MRTIILNNGVSVQLEERVCSNGCGVKFECTPSSNQQTARSNCESSCLGMAVSAKERRRAFTQEKGSTVDYLPTVSDLEKKTGYLISEEEMRTASENAENTKDKFHPKSGRKVVIGLEGDYFFVGKGQDGVLYLGGDKSLPLLKSFLKSEDLTLSRELVESYLFGKKGSPIGGAEGFLARVRSMLKRNFGGEWFIPLEGGWKLCPDEGITVSVKEHYSAVFTRGESSNMWDEPKPSEPQEVKVKEPKKEAVVEKKLDISILNGSLSVGSKRAVFSNRPLVGKLLEAFAYAKDYTMTYEEMFKALYGNEDTKGDYRRCQGLVARLRKSLNEQIPNIDWIIEKDGAGKNNTIHWCLAAGCLDVKFYYSRQFIEKQNRLIANQKTQEKTEGMVVPIESARTFNVSEKEEVSMEAKAKIYEESVEEAKCHLGAMHQHRVAVARVACRACDIRLGGGNHWKGHEGVYTLKRFAKDIGMPYKTLSNWVGAFRLVISKIDPADYDESDWSATRRTYERARNHDISDRDKIRDIYDDERGRNGSELDINRMIKYTRYHVKKVPSLDTQFLDEEVLVQLLVLVEKMKENVSEKLEVKRRNLKREERENSVEIA